MFLRVVERDYWYEMDEPFELKPHKMVKHTQATQIDQTNELFEFV